MEFDHDTSVVWKVPDNSVTAFSDEDIWDDTALIKAYDKAVAQVKEGMRSESSDCKQVDIGKRKKKRKSKKNRKKLWTVGSKCMSLFSEDGLYYEATILSLDIEVKFAHVKYDYYDNEEDVNIDDVLPVASKFDMESADYLPRNDSEQQTTENEETIKKGIEPSQFASGWSVSDICFAPNDRGFYQQAVINSIVSVTVCHVTFIKSKKKKEVKISNLQSKLKQSSEKHKSSHNSEVQQWPPPFNISSQIPPSHLFPGAPPLPYVNGFNSSFNDWNGLFQSRCSPRPPFPPPPVIPNDVIAGDEEALANMLMSWYMSGYHTGYYQGMKQYTSGRSSSNMRDGEHREQKSTHEDSSM